MPRFPSLLLLLACLPIAAQADVWKWVDAEGNTHFVDTKRPIYTWTDQWGKVYYSDTPDHEDAISVQLVWVSDGDLEGVDDDPQGGDSGGYAFPGETAEMRAERLAAEAYYCKRAREAVEAYRNAPSLYRTDDAGERVTLSEEEAAATIADAEQKRKAYCHES